MPPKKNRTSKKKKGARPKNSNNELQKVTRMLANMQKPSSQVTDLGRMLLQGGNMLGGLIGMPTIFGSGSYDIKQNSLWSPDGQVPFMHSSSETVTLRHREFVTDVTMAGPTFTSTTFDINPGLASLFPFLSSIARNFQEYSFKGLVFEYKTTSSTALTTGTNTAMGVIMMAIQYRADAPPFANKTELLNTMWSVDSVPSQHCVLPVECAPAENPFMVQYVRESPVLTGDIKMYDLGQVVVASAGGQAGQNNVVGELWVSYEVELRKPIVSANPLFAGVRRVATNWDSNNPLGITAVNSFNTLGCTFTATSWTIPAGFSGSYWFMLEWAGGLAVCAPPGYSVVNFTVGNSGVLHQSDTPAGGSTVMSTWFALTIIDSSLPSTLNLSVLGVYPTVAGAGDATFIAMRLPPTFNPLLF